MIYFCVGMETTNIAPAQSAQGSTRPSVGSSPKSLPTVSWKAVAMPRAGDYEKVSSSPQVNTVTKRMAKASVRHTHDSPSRGGVFSGLSLSYRRLVTFPCAVWNGGSVSWATFGASFIWPPKQASAL